MQTDFLCLGQSSNSRNVEPFVGPVTTQRLEMLTCLQVPKHDRTVITAACQRCPVGTSAERLYCPLIGFTHEQTFAAPYIPPAQPAIIATTDQDISDRPPDN